MRKNILVTGGAGFIGANFVHYWLAAYPQANVVVVDALTYAGNKANLAPVLSHPNLIFVHENICNTAAIELLLKQYKLGAIVHFAAESHVDRSISGPDLFIETNVVGTHSLLKAAKNVWLSDTGQSVDHRFHHVSTDEVYGSLAPTDAPFKECTPFAPNSPYSASKAASDHLVRAYHHTYSLNVTTSHCSNNFGAYQFPEKLIPLLVTNLLLDKPLPVYGDGLQVRDWLSVEDHCRGIDVVLQNGRVGESYNIGANNEWANIDIVKLVGSTLEDMFRQDSSLARKYPTAKSVIAGRAHALINYVQDRPGHDRRYAVDASKVMVELGYAPQDTFESDIKRTLRWYVDNDSWWRSVLDGSYRVSG